MTQWYYARGGQQLGPVTLEELRSLARSGQLDPKDLVWNSSMPDWLPAATVGGIIGSADAAPPNPYATPDSAFAAVPEPAAPLEEIPPGSEPIDVMECIKRGFELTKRHFLILFLAGLSYFGVSMAVNLPFAVIQGVSAVRNMPVPPPSGSSPAEQQEYLRRLQHQQQQFGPLEIVHQTVSILVSIFFSIGLSRIGLNVVSGKEATIGQLFSGGSKMLRMLGAMILLYLMMIAGFILLIVPGFYVAMRFGQVTFAIVDKDMGIIEAFKYSSSITSNNRLSLFGLGILAGLIAISGLIALCIGIVFTMPIAWLSMVVAYRWLQYGRQATLDHPGTQRPLLS